MSTKAWLASSWKMEWESAEPAHLQRHNQDPVGKSWRKTAATPSVDPAELPLHRGELLQIPREGVGPDKQHGVEAWADFSDYLVFR